MNIEVNATISLWPLLLVCIISIPFLIHFIIDQRKYEEEMKKKEEEYREQGITGTFWWY